MTLEEIGKEVLLDYNSVTRKADYLAPSLRRPAIKSGKKYFRSTFNYESPRKNHWFVFVEHFVTEMIIVYVITYVDDDGYHGIMVTNTKTLVHFSPHFLQRYNERFLKIENASKKEILLKFIPRNNVGMFIEVPSKEYGDNAVFGNISNGVVLGCLETISRVPWTFCRTFLSNDMLFENQQFTKEIAESYRGEYNEQEYSKETKIRKEMEEEI